MSATNEELIQKYKKELPEDYIKAVFELAKAHVDRRILNDSSSHAQLLIECMIGNAAERDTVRIYSGELNSKCFRDALDSTQANVKILVDNLSDGKNVIDGLQQAQRDKIEIRQVSERLPNHFYTVGNEAFRFELDHGKANAIANFNEPDATKKLITRFDKMWENSSNSTLARVAE